METERTDRAASTASIQDSIIELFRSGRNGIRRFGQEIAPELTPVGFGVLRHLALHDSMRAGEVAATFEMDKAAMSRIITQLRELGLIATEPDPDDGRAVRLVVTDETRQRFRRGRDAMSTHYRSVFEDWSDDELAQFAGYLARMTDSLG